jgi:hypothetical protein
MDCFANSSILKEKVTASKMLPAFQAGGGNPQVAFQRPNH